MNTEQWIENLDDLCVPFQEDLSSLVDGELDEPAAARVLVHIDSCRECREFFSDIQRFVHLHKDMSDPDRIMVRMAQWSGKNLTLAADRADLNHRLSTILYQLGKAYTLLAIDPGFRERVFEAPVAVDQTKNRGRGFVDGILASGRVADRSPDWQEARHLLNGRLERITDPLEKGRRLLDSALTIDSTHEEARLYLAYILRHEGRRLQAADAFREVFDTALAEVNRGHAANQLGRLYSAEGDQREASKWFRWVVLSGLADRDDRFWVARFNLGLSYALRGDADRSLTSFRTLLDRHPTRVGEVAQLFANARSLQMAIDDQPGFSEALVSRCPELFTAPTHGAGPVPD
jgi:tetratricopeptide (TPR) repeat protein